MWHTRTLAAGKNAAEQMFGARRRCVQIASTVSGAIVTAVDIR